MARAARRVALGAALLAAACAAPPIVRRPPPAPVRFTENDPEAIAQIAHNAAARPAPTTPPMVVLTALPPARGISAYSLPDGARRWSSNLPVDARPWTAGDVVVTHVPGDVVVIDAVTGRERFRVGDRGLSLIGAAGDGLYVTVSLARGGLEERHGVVLVLDPVTGATRYENEMEQAPGVPTAAAGYAFVPIDGQSILVVDGGEERAVARLAAEDDMVARTEGEGGVIYFGGRVVYRMARESGAGRREGAPTWAPPRDDLPGQPHVLPYGYGAAYAGINARERVALIARPDPAREGVRFVDDNLYLLFHRVVFALDATRGQVRWAHAFAYDVAGLWPARGVLAVVEQRGQLSWLDAATGAVFASRALNAQAAQAVFQLPLEGVGPRAPAGEGAEAARPLTESLAAVAAVRDSRLVPARVFAIRTLASQPGAEVTRALLELATAQDAPQEVRAAAGDALVERHEGGDALLAALERRYDWVAQTSAPPVGYLARALAAAHEHRATHALVAHLRAPATPAADLAPLVTALRELNDPAALPALMDFVVTYHADQGPVPPVGGRGEPVTDRTPADHDALVAAVGVAAEGLARAGGALERRRLRELLADAETLPPVRQAIERGLAPPPAPHPAVNTTNATNAHPNANASATPPPPPPGPPLPPRPTPEAIRAAFTRVRPQMLRCIPRGTAPPHQLRVRFRYDGEGNVLAPVVVTPPQWQACVAPIAQRVRLPRSQVYREDGSFYVLGEP